MSVEMWDAIKNLHADEYFQMENEWFEDLYEDPSQEIDRFLKKRIY